MDDFKKYLYQNIKKSNSKVGKDTEKEI